MKILAYWKKEIAGKNQNKKKKRLSDSVIRQKQCELPEKEKF